MKKVALLIALMTIIALATYAQGATVTVTGAVKAQWGMDIDNATTGFKYVLDGLQLVMKPAVEKGSEKKTGADGETMYGEIAIAGLRLESDTGYNGMGGYSSTPVVMKTDALSAKLVLGPLSIMIKDGASTEINYEGKKADAFWLTNAYDYLIFSNRYGSSDSDQSAATANSWESWNQIQFVTPGQYYTIPLTYGVMAKYSVPKVVDLGLDIASFKPWDSITTYDTIANDNDNAYTGRVTASVTAVPNLTLNAGGTFALNYAAGTALDATKSESLNSSIGGRVSYAIVIDEETSITPGAAIDVNLAATPLTSVTGGLTIKFAKSTITANAGMDLNTSTLAYTIAAVIGAVDGLTLNAAYEGIDGDIAVTGNETMAIHGKLGYGIKVSEKATLTPCVQVSLDNKVDLATDVAADTDVNDLFVKFALDLTGAIANTKLSINWDSNDMMDETVNAQKLGQVVFTTRISF